MVFTRIYCPAKPNPIIIIRGNQTKPANTLAVVSKVQNYNIEKLQENNFSRFSLKYCYGSKRQSFR